MSGDIRRCENCNCALVDRCRGKFCESCSLELSLPINTKAPLHRRRRGREGAEDERLRPEWDERGPDEVLET